MERIPVKSRDIAVVGYDAEANTLEVVFRLGGVYHYKDVAPGTHREFLNAPSLGTYFRDHIRENYAFEKIS